MSSPKVGAGDTAPAPLPAIFDATEHNFEAAVVLRSRQAPILVDSGAEWCAPCRVLGPLLHRLAAAYDGRFLLANVDADENMRIAGRHKVRGFPTVIAYSHGVEVNRFHSSQTEGFLRRFIDDLIRHHAEHGHSALLSPSPETNTTT